MTLDDIGWMILEILQEDARSSYREIAEQVGLTAPAVAARVRRMEKAGLIKGYHVSLDHEQLGLPLLATIRVTTREPGAIDRVAELATQLEEIVVCHRVTGAENYFIEATVASPAHLESIISDLVDRGAGTLTSIVTSSPKARTVITREAVERIQGSA